MTIHRYYLCLLAALACVLWAVVDARFGITIFHVITATPAGVALVIMLLDSLDLVDPPASNREHDVLPKHPHTFFFSLINFLAVFGFIASAIVIVVFKTYFIISIVGFYTLCGYVTLHSLLLLTLYRLAVSQQRTNKAFERFEKPFYRFVSA